MTQFSQPHCKAPKYCTGQSFECHSALFSVGGGGIMEPAEERQGLKAGYASCKQC